MTSDSRTGLTDQELAILDFERRRWRFPVAKEQAISQTFNMSGPKYYRILNELIDRQDAFAVDPLLVKRLRKLRDLRQKERLLPQSAVEVR